MEQKTSHKAKKLLANVLIAARKKAEKRKAHEEIKGKLENVRLLSKSSDLESQRKLEQQIAELQHKIASIMEATRSISPQEKVQQSKSVQTKLAEMEDRLRDVERKEKLQEIFANKKEMKKIEILTKKQKVEKERLYNQKIKEKLAKHSERQQVKKQLAALEAKYHELKDKGFSEDDLERVEFKIKALKLALSR